MIVKYRTNFSNDRIEKVECIRETEQFVMLPKLSGGERRAAKRSYDWDNYHDSWDDAHQFLIDKAQQEVSSIRIRLERANGKLGNVKGMKQPKEVA